MQSILPDSAELSDGRLHVGGCDAVSLAKEFGTPVIVFDRQTFEARAKAFAASVGPSNVFYAGKAFLCIAVCKLLNELDLSLDVCTGGELETALQAVAAGHSYLLDVRVVPGYAAPLLTRATPKGGASEAPS